MKKYFIIPILVLLFGAVPTARAADIFFTTAKEQGSLKVNVYLDTKADLINAVGATITFPEKLLDLKVIEEGGSIINLWVDKPVASEGAVHFSGITPGGFRGQKGFLATLVFAETGQGRATFSAKDLQILRNDGLGTAVAAVTKPASIIISPTTFAYSSDDAIPPEDFRPTIYHDSLENKWFISFLTQDKGVGVDRYELAAEAATPVWKPAVSPAEISNPDQVWLVKAIDKNNNERIARLAPAKAPTQSWLKVGIYAILLIACLYLCFTVGRNMFRSKK